MKNQLTNREKEQCRRHNLTEERFSELKAGVEAFETLLAKIVADTRRNWSGSAEVCQPARGNGPVLTVFQGDVSDTVLS